MRDEALCMGTVVIATLCTMLNNYLHDMYMFLADLDQRENNEKGKKAIFISLWPVSRLCPTCVPPGGAMHESSGTEHREVIVPRISSK